MRYTTCSFSATISLFVLAVLFLLIPTVRAQSTRLISYRGELTPPNSPLVDTVISIQFSIYSDSMGGSPLWSEVQTKVKTYKSPLAAKLKIDKCLFNVLLGTVTQIPDSAYAKKNRYVAVKIGNDPEMIPRKLISLDAEFDAYIPRYNLPNSEYIGIYDYAQPKFVKAVQPKYPQLAKLSGVTGTVYIEIFIDKGGKVSDARIYKDTDTNAGLEEAAKEAAKASEFVPATLDDQPVAVRIVVPYVFSVKSKK